MHVTHPAYLHQLSDHDNTEAVLLPHHPPEVIHRLLLGSWWRKDERTGGDRKQEPSKACTLNKKGVVVAIPLIIMT